MGGKSEKQLSSTSELGWHADESYLTEYPEALALFAVRIPKEGGRTHWANTQTAYAGLDANTKLQLEGLMAHHEFQHFDNYLQDLVEFESAEKKRVQYAYVKCAHPVVRIWRGEKFLCLNHGYTARIEDAPAELLPRLLEHIVSPQHVYSHEWREGDLVVSNNQVLIHRRDRFNDPQRFLFRGLFNFD
jgi:taurine dioxygenase